MLALTIKENQIVIIAGTKVAFRYNHNKGRMQLYIDGPREIVVERTNEFLEPKPKKEIQNVRE